MVCSVPVSLPPSEIRCVWNGSMNVALCGNDSLDRGMQKNQRQDAAKQATSQSIAEVPLKSTHVVV